MSFVKTLATLAVGFAAARGVDKFRKSGGMDGMKDAMRSVGKPGGVADQMGEFADKMGVPGGKDAVRDMFSKFGTQAASATEATEAGAVTGSMPGNAILEENAKLMIRAMIQAAKADGEIDADERSKIMDHLSDASDEEIAFVAAELDAPIDIDGLARDAGEHTKAQVYSAALMAISVDTEQEKQYLANLAAALGLEAAKVMEIHRAMGKPLA